MNPKGVEKVRQKWEESEKKEREYREKVREACRKGDTNAQKDELLQALQASSSMSSPIRTLSDDEVARISAQKNQNRGVMNELSDYDRKVTQILNPKFTDEPPPSLMEQIANRKVT